MHKNGSSCADQPFCYKKFNLLGKQSIYVGDNIGNIQAIRAAVCPCLVCNKVDIRTS